MEDVLFSLSVFVTTVYDNISYLSIPFLKFIFHFYFLYFIYIFSEYSDAFKIPHTLTVLKTAAPAPESEACRYLTVPFGPALTIHWQDRNSSDRPDILPENGEILWTKRQKIC